MAFRKERDRLKEIDTELNRIKKDLLLIDKSLKTLNKAAAPAEEPSGAKAKQRAGPPAKKGKPAPKDKVPAAKAPAKAARPGPSAKKGPAKKKGK